MYATYNLADDKIRLNPDRRLTEAEYREAKELEFAWWPGQKLFVAKWSPAREDFILSLNAEYEHIVQVDDPEGRAERFSRYADNAQSNATTAQEKASRISGMIPFGQPILVGHHSERRHRNDLDRIDRNMTKAFSERERADYWRRRAEETIKRQERRERPDAILRRIRNLEADEKHFQREISTGSYVDFYTRWLAHTQNRLDYERALYTASGGTDYERMEKAGVTPVVGGYVFWRGSWCEVLKVNPKTVKIKIATGGAKGLQMAVDKAEIKAIKTAEEYANI